ncbi:divergent polysaccharide deacetylase family protein [Campylobacter jejuni]|uniref:divergent polysaccharide deacetylase family protein n=1 Tax=Campylobacter jejuni TaxID=197 RepID=UPI003B9D672F
MSKKKLVQIQRYLIIAILFLLCIALALGILVKYQNSQDVSSVKPDYFIDKQEDLISSNKDHYEIDIFQENEFNNNNNNNKSVSILEQKIQEIDDLNTSLNEQNLSSVEQNLSLEQNQSLEQNFIRKDTNLIQDQNLTFDEDIHLNKISKKPKLAIIIDDMANASQVRGLKVLNLKLNPSFFPPDKNHSETPKLALKFDFYMVHLPLAAINYNKPELDTLNPNDSKERIFKKIKQIKKDFKDLRYINNHTGSLFTSNEEAMRKLYEALKNQNIFFVDSKTIGNSKANKIAKELNVPYIQRDVFLDNEDDVNYVKKQIQNAVKLAQKKGFAIAIGHPRKNTFKALEQSKDLLKSVELVYLSEIYGK